MIGPFSPFSNHLQAPTMSESENTSGTGLRKTRVGVVTSDAMQKTIVVEVRRRVPHPRFKKIVKRTSTFYAHDENGHAEVGGSRTANSRPGWPCAFPAPRRSGRWAAAAPRIATTRNRQPLSSGQRR